MLRRERLTRVAVELRFQTASSEDAFSSTIQQYEEHEAVKNLLPRHVPLLVRRHADRPIGRLGPARDWAHLNFVSTAGNTYDADTFGDTSNLPAAILQA